MNQQRLDEIKIFIKDNRAGGGATAFENNEADELILLAKWAFEAREYMEQQISPGFDWFEHDDNETIRILKRFPIGDER